MIRKYIRKYEPGKTFKLVKLFELPTYSLGGLRRFDGIQVSIALFALLSSIQARLPARRKVENGLFFIFCWESCTSVGWKKKLFVNLVYTSLGDLPEKIKIFFLCLGDMIILNAYSKIGLFPDEENNLVFINKCCDRRY